MGPKYLVDIKGIDNIMNGEKHCVNRKILNNRGGSRAGKKVWHAI